MNRALGAIGLLFVLGIPANAQQDSSVQLLQEVRLLRQAIETLVSTGSRVQIVLGAAATAGAAHRHGGAAARRHAQTLARASRAAAEMKSRVEAIEESAGLPRSRRSARSLEAD